MKSGSVVGLLCVVSVWLAESQGEKLGPHRDLNVVDFLDKLGYLDNTGHAATGEKLKRAVGAYQRFHRLPATGELDADTMEMMKRRECMFPDVIKRQSPVPTPQEYRTVTLMDDPPLYKMRVMTYRIYQYPTNMAQYGLSQGSIRREIRKAFDTWQAVIPVDFRETRGKPTFDIAWVPRNHQPDTWKPFDGVGGKLAHADLPDAHKEQMYLHFDDAEPWVLKGEEGNMIARTAAHEIGHLLGLVHSRDPEALMRGWTIGYEQEYELAEDDIRGVQSIYGFRPGGPHPTGVYIPYENRTTTAPPPTTPRPRPTRRTKPTTTTTTPAPTRPMTQPWCGITFDAIEQVHNNKIYGFYQDSIYEITENDPIIHDLNRLYRGAPSNVGAVVYNPKTGKTTMFKGSQWWRFTGFNLDSGFPKRVTAGYENIDAACMIDSNASGKEAVVVFRGPEHSFWLPTYSNQRWNKRTTKGFVLEAGDRPTAIFHHRATDHVISFQGIQYWESKDNIGRRMKTLDPTDFRPRWLNCGRPL